MGTSSEVSSPHIVAVPFPAQGHITPLMQVCKKLADRGFIITFVNTFHNHNRLLQNSSFHTLSPDIRLEAVSDGLPPHHARTASIVELCHAVSSSMAPSLVCLLETLAARSPAVSCLLCDLTLPFGHRVASRFGLTYAAFWTRSATYFAAVQLFCKGLWPPRELQDGDRALSPPTPDLSSYFPGAPPIRPDDMSSVLLSNDPSDFMFKFVTSPISDVSEAAWILINTFEELEAAVLNVLAKDVKISTVGPLLPPEFLSNSLNAENETALWPEQHNCLQWLDKKPTASVLYVSFGSITVFSEKQFQEFALGLQSSGQSFLWVVRSDMMSGNSAMFLEGFLDEVKERALCVSWAPQLRVLSHPAVGGFLTHGGWNSVLEAVAAGVPMLGWSYFADQRANCKCVADGWKIGISLEAADASGLVTKEEVETKVRFLMQRDNGRKVRERVDNLKIAAATALSIDGSSYSNWEAFAHGLESTIRPSARLP